MSDSREPVKNTFCVLGELKSMVFVSLPLTENRPEGDLFVLAD